MGATRLQVNYALKTKSLTVTVVSGVISVSGFRLYIKGHQRHMLLMLF